MDTIEMNEEEKLHKYLCLKKYLLFCLKLRKFLDIVGNIVIDKKFDDFYFSCFYELLFIVSEIEFEKNNINDCNSIYSENLETISILAEKRIEEFLLSFLEIKDNFLKSFKILKNNKKTGLELIKNIKELKSKDDIINKLISLYKEKKEKNIQYYFYLLNKRSEINDNSNKNFYQNFLCYAYYKEQNKKKFIFCDEDCYYSELINLSLIIPNIPGIMSDKNDIFIYASIILDKEEKELTEEEKKIKLLVSKINKEVDE